MRAPGTCLLWSAGPPRPLPSFPTRRSSDLPSFGAPLVPGDGPDADRAAEDRERRPRVGDQDADGAGEDRKSTRLNSSHVAISYAVFCLKKKKQTRALRTSSI